jgi:glutathione S-transferase
LDLPSLAGIVPQDREIVERRGETFTLPVVPTLYTADRCPYAARVRIVLADKGLVHDIVEIDLDDRPAWLYEKNALGRVPVYEEDGGLVLPESLVIMEYHEERYPEPPLWPADAAERALGRLWLERFDDRLGDAYYALRRGEPRAELDARLAELDRALEAQPYLSGREYGLADAGYVPWILRALDRFGVELAPALADWLERLSQRPAIAAERHVVAAL